MHPPAPAMFVLLKTWRGESASSYKKTRQPLFALISARSASLLHYFHPRSSLWSLVTGIQTQPPYSLTERQPHSRPMSSTSPLQTPVWYPAAATFVFNVASTGLFVACWQLWCQWREIRDMGKVSCWQLCCKLAGQIGHFVLCFLKFASSTAVLVDCFIPSHQKEVLRTLLSFTILLWVIISVCCLYPLKGYAYLS